MTIRNRKPRQSKIGQAEQLESRAMLSGHGFAAGFSHFTVAAAEHFSAHAAVTPAVGPWLAGHSQVFGMLGVGAESSQGTVLTAQLTDPSSSATGNVTYKTSTEGGTTETEFKVTISGAAANTTLGVSIGDTQVGEIKTDANGAGSLELSSNPEGNEQPLPANFPASVDVGAGVAAGSLSGTLAAATHSGSGCGSESGSDSGSDSGSESDSGSSTRLVAQLTDANSSATAKVAFHTVTYDGTTYTKLAVKVSGAAANSTLDVSIGDIVVGQVTTDDNGSGKLVLSSNPHGNQQPLPADFPTTIADGTAVTVGTTSGTFATQTGHEYGHWMRFGWRR